MRTSALSTRDPPSPIVARYTAKLAMRSNVDFSPIRSHP